MRESEAGFTLIELLVGAAIAAVVLLLAVTFVARLTGWTASLDRRVQSNGAAERLMDRLETEAASAWAVYVPATDVLGNANADGHEIDLYAQDGSHRPYQWAYAYDAASKTITRYSDAPGVGAQAGEQIGPLDAFSAVAVDVTQLGTMDSLFAGATAPRVRYAFPATSAVGGNALVDVTFTASGVNRDELLASGTAPTTYTVVLTYTPSPAPLATATPPPLVMTSATP